MTKYANAPIPVHTATARIKRVDERYMFAPEYVFETPFGLLKASVQASGNILLEGTSGRAVENHYGENFERGSITVNRAVYAEHFTVVKPSHETGAPHWERPWLTGLSAAACTALAEYFGRIDVYRAIVTEDRLVLAQYVAAVNDMRRKDEALAEARAAFEAATNAHHDARATLSVLATAYNGLADPWA